MSTESVTSDREVPPSEDAPATDDAGTDAEVDLQERLEGSRVGPGR